MSERILVVEDDDVTRKVLVRILRSGGFEVSSATDGAEALELLGAASYDVLVTDLVMGGMSGLDLVRRARALRAAIRCVVVSGQPEPEGGVEGVVWVGKPLDVDRLLAAIG